MKLKELQFNWDEFGKTDALWAILADPTKKGRRWSPSEFFETGRKEIVEAMACVQLLPVKLKPGRALDFGCGVGRVTQALCEYFTECHGVDIAPSMIRLAKKYNRFADKCQYHLNDLPDLSLFTDGCFDFIYSSLVLQHMEPEFSKGYLKEFIRVLAPGGLLVFQLPSEPNRSEETPGLTLTATALPDTAFKAQIRLGELTDRMNAGAQVAVSARVKNISDVVWPATWKPDGWYRIQLGNHWLDKRGRLIRQDDGRTLLPRELNPQEEVNLSLPVHVPDVNGVYMLELDMVQEHVAWFASKGSQTARTLIRVVNGRTIPLYGWAKKRAWLYGVCRVIPLAFGPLFKTTAKPVMETYCIPKSEVIDYLQQIGGTVLDVQRYDVVGPYWVSFRYYVTK